TESVVASISTSSQADDGTSWEIHSLIDTGAVPPAFGAGTFFAVDYSRPAVLRVPFGDPSTTDSPVDVIDDELPRGAGGIATDAVDVFTRSAQGIVKVPVGSGSATPPVVVVPSAKCSIVDPADGTTSNLEDTLAIDGSTL